MKLSRRNLIRNGACLALGATWPAATRAQTGAALDAATLGLKAGSGEDQTAILVRLAERAVREGKTLMLPPGRFMLREAQLPAGIHLAGAPGTQLMAASPGAAILRLRGAAATLASLTLLGTPVAEPADTALVACENVAALEIHRCRFLGAPRTALSLHGSGGRITDNIFEGTGHVAIHALDSAGLDIRGNFIRRCGNNGIRVWRSAKGHDGTRVSGNRIEDVRADAGGSGENGNAINFFRAGGCIAEGNVIRRVA